SPSSVWTRTKIEGRRMSVSTWVIFIVSPDPQRPGLLWRQCGWEACVSKCERASGDQLTRCQVRGQPECGSGESHHTVLRLRALVHQREVAGAVCIRTKSLDAAAG